MAVVEADRDRRVAVRTIPWHLKPRLVGRAIADDSRVRAVCGAGQVPGLCLILAPFAVPWPLAIRCYRAPEVPTGFPTASHMREVAKSRPGITHQTRKGPKPRARAAGVVAQAMDEEAPRAAEDEGASAAVALEDLDMTAT